MMPMLLSYIGPETMLPLTSVIAGIVGAFLMFGRNTFRFVTRRFRDPSRKS